MLSRMQSWPCPLNLTEWVHRYSWGSWKVLVAQLCPTLCDPMDYGSSVHEFLQARILEWVAIPFSRGSSQISNPGLLHYYHPSHQGNWSQTLFLRFFPDLDSLHLKVKASSLPCSGRFKIATWFFKTAVSERQICVWCCTKCTSVHAPSGKFYNKCVFKITFITNYWCINYRA